MQDTIAITVNLDNGKSFRKVFEIVTEYGSTDEIQTAVNRILNRDFPVGKFCIISSTWSYTE